MASAAEPSAVKSVVCIEKNMPIRQAVPEDSSAISTLIVSLAHHFLLQADGVGAEGFLATLRPESIEGKIVSSEVDYYTYVAGGQLMGVVGVRDRTHLFHLFVDQEFQGQGIARALWSHVSEVYGWTSAKVAVTVNSTPFALPFYEHVGFQASGPRVEKNGVAFIPMRLEKT